MKQYKGRAETSGSQPVADSRNGQETGINFNMPKDTSVGIIKVIGVGGGGCNAVRNMYKEGITNVTYLVCNTDSQQLVRCPVPVKLQLGSDGLGAGGNPEKGREEAELTRDRIKAQLNDGTKMAFVTASMGGGTGTGAAPIVAQVAREMGILTIGIVTIPFSFEGQQKIMKALRGMEEMRRSVDALLVVQNDKLTGGMFKELPDGTKQRIAMKDKFKDADNILKDAAKSISELITLHTDGDINLDFRDVETTMKNGGDAIMAAGRASGEHRVERAIIQALDSPLLYGSDIGHAQRILFDIYTSDEEPLYIDEMEEIEEFMQQLDPDIEVIWGTSTDNSLGKDVKVIILAAGIAKEMRAGSSQPQPTMDDEYFRALMQQLYASHKAAVRTVVEKTLEFNEDENENNSQFTIHNSQCTMHNLSNENGNENEEEEVLRQAEAAREEPTDKPSDTEPQEEAAPSSFQSFLQRAKDWLMNLTNE